MGIIAFILLGLIAGAIARAIHPGESEPGGFIGTLAIGVAGALIGGLIATQLLEISETDEFDFATFLIAVGVSVVLLAIYERFARARDRDERDRRPA